MFHGSTDGESGPQGQNIYWTSTGEADTKQATQAWYDELTDPGYDFANPGFKDGTGHFTQVAATPTLTLKQGRCASSFALSQS